MKKFLFGAVIMAGFFVSCTSRPATVAPVTPIAPPAPPLIPAVPERIMGAGLVKSADLAAFLLAVNQNADAAFVRDLAAFYVEEAAVEGVNHDVAFAQMCLETGYLRYGNLVTPDMNNFCGLGAIDAAHPGERFPTPRTGVRAHIQHLKGYATEAPLAQDLVDPRYKWVVKGSAPTIAGLAGKWATDPDYAAKINSILVRLYDRSFGSEK